METIEKKNFPLERALYGKKNLHLVDCTFQGKEDGESALKECQNILLERCYMDLRYPLWHDSTIKLIDCTQTENCRASLWYSNDITIQKSKLNGIKVLRECSDIKIEDSTSNSPEFGWKCNRIEVNNSDITSQYIFFLSKNLKAKNTKFTGKYGFQYMENVECENCEFDTKDAFWHSKNVVVKNSIVKGEYLAWYSENLTFINCTLIGIQPLCYCKNLRLINCKMVDATFAFEYSDVEADIIGELECVKNPRSGYIAADKIHEIMITDDSKYPVKAKIIQRQ